MTLQSPTVVGPGDGEHWWFLNTLMTVKAGGSETAGGMTVIECVAPPGFGPPPHRHDIEDELFYVVEGEVTFWCAGAEATYGPGGFAYLPKQLPHRFQVGDQGARILQITTPAQFEDFVSAVGEPAAEAVLPQPTEPDVAKLAEICQDFQIELLL